MGWRWDAAEREAWRQFGRRHSRLITRLYIAWRLLLPAAVVAALAITVYGAYYLLTLAAAAAAGAPRVGNPARLVTATPWWVWFTPAATAAGLALAGWRRHTRIPLRPETRHRLLLACVVLTATSAAGAAAKLLG